MLNLSKNIMGKSINDIFHDMCKRDPEIRAMFEIIMPRQAAYRFYLDKETKDRYFYTKSKIEHGQGKYFVAGIYRYYKTKKRYHLVKKVGFAKKRNAMDWAYEKYMEAIRKRKGEEKKKCRVCGKLGWSHWHEGEGSYICVKCGREDQKK